MKTGRASLHRFIAEHTRHADPFVRCDAARLLGEIRAKSAVPWLAEMLAHDPRHSKINAIYALAEIKDRRAVPVLLDMAVNPGVFDFSGFYNHDMIRYAAALALALLGDARGAERVADLLRIGHNDALVHLSPYISGLPNSPLLRPFKKQVDLAYLLNPGRSFNTVRDARIAESLRHYRTPESLAALRNYSKHYSRYVRAHAAGSLSHLDPSPAATLYLKKGLRREKALFTRIILARELARRGVASAWIVLVRGLENPDYFIRATATEALGALGDASASPAITRRLADEHFYVRLCAVEALEKLKCRESRPEILKCFERDHPRVRMQAAKYLMSQA